MAIRLFPCVLLAAAGMLSVGCTYNETAPQPTPVVIQTPPPPSGTVVVQPAP